MPRTRYCGRELDAARERERRLELRLAELERRLRMDSTDSGTPTSKEPIGARERRRAERQESERERRKDRRRGGQPGHPGRGLARDPDPGERKDADPPAQCRRCGTGLDGAAPAGAGVGAGRGRAGHQNGDGVGAAGPAVPVLRERCDRGPAIRRARRFGIVRPGAECGGYLELSCQPGL